jgi:hypothetical protein
MINNCCETSASTSALSDFVVLQQQNIQRLNIFNIKSAYEHAHNHSMQTKLQ